jgi:HEAT repeat protein
MHSRAAAAAFLSMFLAIGVVRADAVADLAKNLESPDAATQIKAVNDLCEMGVQAKAAIPALIKSLSNSNQELQWRAAAALSEMGPEAKDAVPALIKGLKSDDPLVRGHSAHALEEIGTASQSAVPTLAAMLNDKETHVRRAAIDALVGIHPEPKVLVPILKTALEQSDMDPSITVPAMNALGEAGDLGMQALVDELKNDKARYWAVLALAGTGAKGKAAVPELAKIVADPDPEMRMQTLIALGEIGPDSKTVLPAIVKALGDKESSVRYGATFALGKIAVSNADGIAQLKKQLDSADPFLKMISAWSLARMSPNDKATVEQAVKLLVESLKADDKHVRAAAARGLFELNVPREQVAPVFAELLADKDPEVQANVAEALATLGEKAIPRIIRALENNDTQSMAVQVIRRLGPKAKDAVPALALEMTDPSGDHRHEVTFALAAIGPDAKAAVPALIKALDDPEAQVRHGATYALGKIGPGAAEAVPALKKNLQSADDAFLKVASVWALVRIQPKDGPLQLLAVPLLAKALEESDRERVKVEVATTLGDLGAVAKPAIPALEKATKDSSPAVSGAATEALKKIRK